MAADRNTPEGVENWLIQSSTNPWSFPSIISPWLVEAIDIKVEEKFSSIAFSSRTRVHFD